MTSIFDPKSGNVQLSSCLAHHPVTGGFSKLLLYFTAVNIEMSDLLNLLLKFLLNFTTITHYRQ